METWQINELLKGVKGFLGTYPTDHLPRVQVNSYPASVVVNTDPSYKPGEHWVAIYISNECKGDYFDSYGLPPLTVEVIDFLNNWTQEWCYNGSTLQSLSSDSKACGQYCVSYIKHRAKGHSTGSFIREFSSSRPLNDLIVEENVEQQWIRQRLNQA